MNKVNSRSLEVDTEMCVANAGGNRYELVIMASARAREIRRQHRSSEKFEHLHTAITSLKEFQDGKYDKEYLKRVK